MNVELAPQGPYNVKLPAFEGPLDLLLHLIREHKIDIYDIPVATITEQYLAYLELMKELNLEIAGEFLVMAATLIHIKSRMLLPVEQTLDTEEPEDPRLELVEKLLAYRELKETALGLRELEDTWENVLFRPPSSEPEEEPEGEPYLFNINLFDLLGAFRTIIEKAPEEMRNITRETLSIKDKMSLIVDVLEGVEAVRFEELFKADSTKTHVIVTFIALLELLRLGLARVYQERDFGSLWIIRSREENLADHPPEIVEPSPS
jgi:segregation and condensation protein A